MRKEEECSCPQEDHHKDPFDQRPDWSEDPNEAERCDAQMSKIHKDE